MTEAVTHPATSDPGTVDQATTDQATVDQGSGIPAPIHVGILIFEQVEVLDFAGPYEVFSRTRLEPGAASRRTDDDAPFRVFTVAATRSSIRATGGLGVQPDYSLADAPRIDLLVIPGGFGTRPLLEDEPTIDWIRRTAGHARWVSSVCTGALLLAKAGLLAGRRATTHHLAYDLLEQTFPNVEVVRDVRWVDDQVLTAGGVASGIDLAFHLVERLLGKAVADETAQYIEYRRAASPSGPP